LRRLCLVAAGCAALPDIDYLGWPVAHRGITHSIAFALIGALAATIIFFRSSDWRQSRARIALILALAFLSHGLLDGLSTYSYGIAYLAPFSTQRFRLWWTPLGDPEGRLVGQLVQEALVVLLPAIVLSWLGLRFRGRASTA
jgi:inner membrane protein